MEQHEPAWPDLGRSAAKEGLREKRERAGRTSPADKCFNLKPLVPLTDNLPFCHSDCIPSVPKKMEI
jgi:hypothetical protein